MVERGYRLIRLRAELFHTFELDSSRIEWRMDEIRGDKYLAENSFHQRSICNFKKMEKITRAF